MGRSLTAFSNIMKEELKEHKLDEIFDSPPFKTSFNLKDTPDWVESERFQDKKGNEIKVYFHKMGREFYEADFTFNYHTERDPDATLTLKEYSELLNTVAAVISQFLEEYKPKAVFVSGADEGGKIFRDPKFESQKNRIYMGYVAKIQDKNNKYMVSKGKEPNTIAIGKR